MAKNIKKFRKDLEQIIATSKDIYILGHNEPDFDAIGSAIGIAKICQILKKEPYIVIKEDNARLQPKVKAVKDANNVRVNFINVEQFLDDLASLVPDEDYPKFITTDDATRKEMLQRVRMKNSTLIITDTNNLDLISIRDYISAFQNIVVIDHHEKIEGQNYRPTISFIDNEYSSASEIVATMLHVYQEKYCESVALALAAGILLDTDGFKKKDSDNTHKVYSVIKKNGVTSEKINALLAKDFETEKLVSNIVFYNDNCRTFRNLLKGSNVSIVVNRNNPEIVLKPEIIAMVADKRQEFADTDVTISFGYTMLDDDKMIKASVRTNGYIDGCKLVRDYSELDKHRPGGGAVQLAGGAIQSAAMLIKSDDILGEERLFIDFLRDKNSEDFKPKKKKKK